MLHCTNTPCRKQLCGISLLVTEEYLQAAKEVIDCCGAKIEGIAKIRRKY